MSLATRCTACDTVFRVVQDQLKVSEGWVRCGRCEVVFNAFEGLLDLERDSAAMPLRAAPAVVEAAVTETDASDAGETAQAAQERRVDRRLFSGRHSTGGRTPAEQVPLADRREFGDAQFDSETPSDDSIRADDNDDQPEVVAATPDAEPAAAERSSTDDEAENEAVVDPGIAFDDHSPDFIRHADRRARWRHPGVRAALAAAGVALTLLLALQVGHHFRDRIAAQWPGLQALLQAQCALFACRIEPPRRIDAVTVDSTALTRLPNSEAFRLSVNLRNRAATAVALPWIDLNVTDNSGVLVSRRALTPQDFHAAEAIAPGAEAQLQLLLTAPGARMTGYTVEIFYP